MYAAVGILLALYQREKTGRGQVIDVSMFESAVAWLGYFPHHYWHRGEEPERLGLRHQYITPYGPYIAGDGKYVGVACASEADWVTFCRDVVQRPDLLTDPRFKDTETRRTHRDALDDIIVALFKEHPSAVWLKRLEAARLPYGSVNSIAEVLAHPQLAARSMIQEIDSPVGRVPVLASPLHLSDSPQRLDPIPELGGDNESILREFGYTATEIETLRRAGVI
jgi:formyl-CoA transferase